MKKLSKIDESAWGDMMRRGSGETVREEDKFNPDYVDFGENTTVYWAIDNLEIDGEVKFYFHDVKDYNNNGWRLPTVDEVNQLKWNIRISWYDGCKHLRFNDGNELRLKINGSGGFHMWTKEINPKFPTGAFSYGFDNMDNFNISSFNISINKLFVFLVKDKNVSESAWGDMMRRGSGEDIRKEDDLTNIRELVPVDMGVSVLWADKDLEWKDGRCYFDFNEVNNSIEKSEWRLPTKKETNELYTFTKITKNTDEVCIIERNFDDKPQLIFNKKGYQYGSNTEMVYRTDVYCGWTSTPTGSSEGYYVLTIDETFSYVNMHYGNRMCVRLVKDKK